MYQDGPKEANLLASGLHDPGELPGLNSSLPGMDNIIMICMIIFPLGAHTHS